MFYARVHSAQCTQTNSHMNRKIVAKTKQMEKTQLKTIEKEKTTKIGLSLNSLRLQRKKMQTLHPFNMSTRIVNT